MDFIAFDVETANANLASICQIGIVSFKNGVVENSWQSLVNPQDEFDGMNVLIHGIDEKKVKNAPILPVIFPQVKERLCNKIIAIHTGFDRASIGQALDKYGLPMFECLWLDTAKVARRTWPELSRSGYGLKPLAKKLGIVFTHHDAENDARAAGEILAHVIKTTGVSICEWMEKVKKPISPANIALNGNPEGQLYGEVAVFTGALSVTRKKAAELAANAGCEVVATVNKNTTLLIVGDQDIQHLAGHEKSNKHRKAEELISKGQSIRVLGETDFRKLVNMAV